MKISGKKVSLKIFVCSLAMNSLGSVTVLSMPLSWMAGLLSLFYCVRLRSFYLFINKFWVISFASILLLTTALFFNFANFFSYIELFPKNVTTGYFFFVGLRYLNFIFFISVVALTFIASSMSGGGDRKRCDIQGGCCRFDICIVRLHRSHFWASRVIASKPHGHRRGGAICCIYLCISPRRGLIQRTKPFG